MKFVGPNKFHRKFGGMGHPPILFIRTEANGLALPTNIFRPNAATTIILVKVEVKTRVASKSASSAEYSHSIRLPSEPSADRASQT
jgi:hypothetical protein